MRPESEHERETRRWMAERSFYAECMSTRDGTVRLRDVLHDLRDCDDPMEPELCERVRCRPGSTYSAGASRVLDLHLTLFSPHDGDVEGAFRAAAVRAPRRVELPPAQL